MWLMMPLTATPCWLSSRRGTVYRRDKLQVIDKDNPPVLANNRIIIAYHNIASGHLDYQ